MAGFDICSVDGCDRTGPKMPRGMCPMHYKRFKRGTLDKPRYNRPRGSVGMNTMWPIEVTQINGDWHRRATGSSDPWQLVVWPERERELVDDGY